MIWTSCDLHKNYMTCTQEVHMYYHGTPNRTLMPRFSDIRNYFLISENRNFWYQKIVSDIKKIISYIRKYMSFWYKKNRTYFLISENDFLTSEIHTFLISEIDFLISENDFLIPDFLIPEINFWYQKWFSDIRKSALKSYLAFHIILHMNMVSDILVMYLVTYNFMCYFSSPGRDCVGWRQDMDMRHCIDGIMGVMASQITILTTVYSSAYSGADQRKHQSSASLAFVRGIHLWPVISPHKWPVTRKMFPYDDVIMFLQFRPFVREATSDSPHKGQYWGRSMCFVVVFHVNLNKLFNKQWSYRLFEIAWH